MGVTRIESNRNHHLGLKIESKSIENRNLEIVTSLNSLSVSELLSEIVLFMLLSVTWFNTNWRLPYGGRM